LRLIGGSHDRRWGGLLGSCSRATGHEVRGTARAGVGWGGDRLMREQHTPSVGGWAGDGIDETGASAVAEEAVNEAAA
jgi:hypothetical protein